MNLIFDTNILIYLARTKNLNQILKFINPLNDDVHISYATVAEIESFAFQNNWNTKKYSRLEYFFEEFQIVEIDDTLLKTFIEIDAFSQRKHPEIKSYPHESPRNMGKHDLWIAATASLLNLKLVTTDQDFQHLNDTFLNLRIINPTDLQKLYNP